MAMVMTSMIVVVSLLQGFKEEGGQKVGYNTMIYNESEVCREGGHLFRFKLP